MEITSNLSAMIVKQCNMQTGHLYYMITEPTLQWNMENGYYFHSLSAIFLILQFANILRHTLIIGSAPPLCVARKAPCKTWLMFPSRENPIKLSLWIFDPNRVYMLHDVYVWDIYHCIGEKCQSIESWSQFKITKKIFLVSADKILTFILQGPEQISHLHHLDSRKFYVGRETSANGRTCQVRPFCWLFYRSVRACVIIPGLLLMKKWTALLNFPVLSKCMLVAGSA